VDVRFYLCQELSKIHHKKVLDVGCNMGIITSSLPKDNEITGVDLDEGLLETAKAINPHATFVKADMLDLKFKPESFDIIYLAHIFPKDNVKSEHEPEDLIESVLPVLKKNGRLIITTTNADNPYYSNKKINYDYLDKMMKRYKLQYEIYPWNPFSIHAHHILRFIPGILSFLRYLSKKKIGLRRCVSFYVEARKL